MIKYVALSGIIVVIVTAVSLGTVLVIERVKRYSAKKRYQKLINEKMNILAELQEELTEEEVTKEKDYTTPPLPSEANLPANFFDQNYLEVKP